jgi:hypothetical protein
MPEQLKYGPIMNEDSCVKVPSLITTGETFRAKSGRFVTWASGTNSYEVADAGDTLLAGWMEIGDGVTVAGDKGALIPAENCNVVFRIPVCAAGIAAALAAGYSTYIDGIIGETCDLVRETVGGVTLIQCADTTASGEDVVKIVDGDRVAAKWVDVIVVPAKVTAGTGVA